MKEIIFYSTDDIWEIRVIFSGNIFRFLGFLHRNKFVVLVHGFQKKTQETPQRDIITAEDIKLSTLEKFANAFGKHVHVKFV
jgi:phage-related protein